MNEFVHEIMAQAVLFDLDGTLVDSSKLSERWWEEWADQAGLERDLVARQARGRAAAEVMRELLPGRPDELNQADAARLDRWEDTHTEFIGAADGAADLLNHLDGRSWAVVTTSSRSQAQARLDAAGLPQPNVLVTSDDVASLKPDPEGYLLAGAALRAAPENCLVIEDSMAGVRAGRSAGAVVLAIGDGTSECAEAGALWVCGLSDVRLLAWSSGLLFGINRVSCTSRRFR
jgi:sugar-phosphatase